MLSTGFFFKKIMFLVYPFSRGWGSRLEQTRVLYPWKKEIVGKKLNKTQGRYLQKAWQADAMAGDLCPENRSIDCGL